jgi:hypothetical protein
MITLTNEGRQAIDEIAARYDLKPESVASLARAVVQGNGTMAQFNVPELGGSGQWMKGGMTMLGDMSNHARKGQVDKLCTELSELTSRKVIFEEVDQVAGGATHDVSGTSWPPAFGRPTSSGAQNNFRYAYFAPVKRLVIVEDGKQKIYDTRHHHISGISQQQGNGNSYHFTSQDGPVDLQQLSLISEPGDPAQALPEIPYDVTQANPSPALSSEDVFVTIEKVNTLFERGFITMEEFKAKKQELLARL